MENHILSKHLMLFMLGIVLQKNVTEAIYTKSIDLYLNPKSSIIQSENAIINPGQVYVFCSKTVHRNTQDLCIFYLETSKNIDSHNHLYFCNYIFEPYQTAGAKRLIAISEDKAVLLISSCYTSMSILDFSDCSYKPMDITAHENIRYANVYAPFAGTFDVVVHGQNGFCFGEGVCKFVLNFDGNIVMATPYPWIDSSDMNFKAMIYSRTKGHLVVDTYEPLFECKARVKAIDGYGSVEVLKEYPSDKSTNTQTCILSASATNHLLSVCALVNSSLTCSQFDLNGIMKFETTFNLNTTTQYHSAKVYNLPGGGLLLLGFECSDYHLNCDKMKGDFMIYKVNARGHINGLLEITQLQCTKDEIRDKIHFFNEKDEMCLSLMCDRLLAEDRARLDIVCFKDEDFNL